MSGEELGKVYADGEVVVRQGEPGDCMFSVQDGRLEVIAEHRGRGATRVAVLERGDTFGEMAIFEKDVRSATVRALGPARVLTIDKRTFLRRIQEDPSLAFNLVRMMSQRIRLLTSQVGEKRRGANRRTGSDRRSSPDRRVDR